MEIQPSQFFFQRPESTIWHIYFYCRIKIQQDIIDLQKIKLERQERLIMELKLNKIIDEHKQSKEEVKQELRTVIKTGEVKNRTKAKCLRIVANLRDEENEDEFSRLRGKALIMPKFLVNMQERAMERNVKHEQAKQRRLQQEAEREAQKIAAEEAKVILHKLFANI